MPVKKKKYVVIRSFTGEKTYPVIKVYPNGRVKHANPPYKFWTTTVCPESVVRIFEGIPPARR